LCRSFSNKTQHSRAENGRRQSPAPVEPQRAETIDFDALRAQAAVALETLQQSRERRLASAARTAF
jgi:hypothetical protein